MHEKRDLIAIAIIIATLIVVFLVPVFIIWKGG